MSDLARKRFDENEKLKKFIPEWCAQPNHCIACKRRGRGQ
jgi:hypothetical protein